MLASELYPACWTEDLGGWNRVWACVGPGRRFLARLSLDRETMAVNLGRGRKTRPTWREMPEGAQRLTKESKRLLLHV